ncbi:MAG: GspH/FimT family pseudopilin [Prochlorococcus sp.]
MVSAQLEDSAMSNLFSRAHGADGFSLLELLIAISILAVMACISLVNTAEQRHRLQVDVAARRLQLGLERARLFALRNQQACGLSVSAGGWQQPLSTVLPTCFPSRLSLQEPVAEASLTWQSNLPELMRFAANGLTLDGGIVVLGSPHSSYRRCLVISLPLGVGRVGRYDGDPHDPAIGLSSSRCLADEAL